MHKKLLCLALSCLLFASLFGLNYIQPQPRFTLVANHRLSDVVRTIPIRHNSYLVLNKEQKKSTQTSRT